MRIPVFSSQITEFSAPDSHRPHTSVVFRISVGQRVVSHPVLSERGAHHLTHMRWLSRFRAAAAQMKYRQLSRRKDSENNCRPIARCLKTDTLSDRPSQTRVIHERCSNSRVASSTGSTCCLTAALSVTLFRFPIQSMSHSRFRTLPIDRFC